jgi:RNA polymerase sigma-70 factor (sigma-E family)
LFRLAYVLTADKHAAEDLLQSALTKAAARWGHIHSAPEGYVRQIMYREQVSWWRHRARRPVTVMARVPELPMPDQMVMVEARLVVRDALLALPPGKRAMLVLRYLEDLSETQVADLLGCSVGTVRSQTHKAITQLRSVLPSLGLTRTEAGR